MMAVAISGSMKTVATEAHTQPQSRSHEKLPQRPLKYLVVIVFVSARRCMNGSFEAIHSSDSHPHIIQHTYSAHSKQEKMCGEHCLTRLLLLSTTYSWEIGILL